MDGPRVKSAVDVAWGHAARPPCAPLSGPRGRRQRAELSLQSLRTGCTGPFGLLFVYLLIIIITILLFT